MSAWRRKVIIILSIKLIRFPRNSTRQSWFLDLHWARKHLHRESLRELSRCRHAALGCILLRPTGAYAGNPGQCRMMVSDSPDPPTTPAFLTSGTPLMHEGRSGEGLDAAVAPGCFCWACGRSAKRRNLRHLPLPNGHHANLPPPPSRHAPGGRAWRFFRIPVSTRDPPPRRAAGSPEASPS